MKTLGEDGFVLDTPDEISAYFKLARLGMLRLEVKGLMGHGQSAYMWVKAKYGLKGNKRNVLTQYEAMLRNEGVLK